MAKKPYQKVPAGKRVAVSMLAASLLSPSVTTIAAAQTGALDNDGVVYVASTNENGETELIAVEQFDQASIAEPVADDEVVAEDEATEAVEGEVEETVAEDEIVEAVETEAVVVDEVAPETEESSSEEEAEPRAEGKVVLASENVAFDTLTAAIQYIYDNQIDNAVLDCEAGADLGKVTHAPLYGNLTINGNGAAVTSGEGDIDITSMTQEATLVVNNLDGCGLWGERKDKNTVTAVFNDCQNMTRTYVTSSRADTLNIELNNCSFDAANRGNYVSVYSNSRGTIAVNGCSFTGIAVPVNLNTKSAGSEMTVTLTNSTFNNCGTQTLLAARTAKGYGASVRLVAQSGSTVDATLSGLTFTGGDRGQNGDILVGEGRERGIAGITSRGSGTVILNANNLVREGGVEVQAQQYAYYTDENSGIVDDEDKVDVFTLNTKADVLTLTKSGQTVEGNLSEDLSVYAVVYDGRGFDTLAAALKAVETDNPESATVVCKAGADLGAMTHANVVCDLTIEGNGAVVTGGERDLAIDTYALLDRDITITVNDLDGIAIWGERKTSNTVTATFTNCQNMQRAYVSGDLDSTLNMTFVNCSFDSNNGSHKNASIYSSYNGDILVEGCSFTGVAVPIAINNKGGSLTNLTVTNSTFDDCGTPARLGEAGANGYGASIRLLAQQGVEVNADIVNCTFSGDQGQNGDILVGEGRDRGEKKFDGSGARGVMTVNVANVTRDNGNVRVMGENYAYYVDEAGSAVADYTKAVTMDLRSGVSATMVKNDQTITTSLDATEVVATVGAKTFSTAMDALTYAGTNGGEVVLLADGETITNTVNIASDMTLNLNGHTLTVTKQGARPFQVKSGSLTVDANGGGFHLSEAAGSYGLIEVIEGADLTLNGVTITGTTDNGSLIRIKGAGTGAANNVTFNEVTVETGDLTRILNHTDSVAMNLTVTGGSYQSDNAGFIVCLTDEGTAVFDGVTMSTVYSNCMEISGGTALVKNCDLTVTGGNQNDWEDSCIGISFGANVTVEGGTYASYSTKAKSVGHALYIYSSGGTLTVNDGTFVGLKGAVKADYSTTYNTPAEVTLNGGTFTGRLVKNTNDENTSIVVNGGTYNTNASNNGVNNAVEYLAEGLGAKFIGMGESGPNVTVDDLAAVQAECVALVDGIYFTNVEDAEAFAGEDSAVSYRVTFSSEGVTEASFFAPAGSKVSQPDAPEIDEVVDGKFFKGWLVDGAAYDFNAPVNAPMDIVASWSAAVAMITPADGNVSVYHETLEKAVEEITDGDTLTLLSDATIADMIEVDSAEITIDVQDFTLTANVEHSPLFRVHANGTLNLVAGDNGVFEIHSKGFARVEMGATITAHGGTFTGSSEDNEAVFHVVSSTNLRRTFSTDTTDVEFEEISSTVKNAPFLVIDADVTTPVALNVTDSEFETEDATVFELNAATSATLENVTAASESSTVIESTGANVAISNSTITTDGDEPAIVATEGELNVSDGTEIKSTNGYGLELIGALANVANSTLAGGTGSLSVAAATDGNGTVTTQPVTLSGVALEGTVTVAEDSQGSVKLTLGEGQETTFAGTLEQLDEVLDIAGDDAYALALTDENGDPLLDEYGHQVYALGTEDLIANAPVRVGRVAYSSPRAAIADGQDAADLEVTVTINGEVETVGLDTPIEVEALTKDGYKFLGWRINGTDQVWTSGMTIAEYLEANPSASGNLDLTPWFVQSSGIVTGTPDEVKDLLVLNGGTALAVTDGTGKVVGYILGGDEQLESGNARVGRIVYGSVRAALADGQDISAIEARVSFVNDGVTTSTWMKLGDALAAPFKDGYTFLGWKVNGHDVLLTPGMTLAQWIEANGLDSDALTLTPVFQKIETGDVVTGDTTNGGTTGGATTDTTVTDGETADEETKNVLPATGDPTVAGGFLASAAAAVAGLGALLRGRRKND